MCTLQGTLVQKHVNDHFLKCQKWAQIERLGPYPVQYREQKSKNYNQHFTEQVAFSKQSPLFHFEYNPTSIQNKSDFHNFYQSLSASLIDASSKNLIFSQRLDSIQKLPFSCYLIDYCWFLYYFKLLFIMFIIMLRVQKEKKPFHTLRQNSETFIARKYH